MAFGSGAVIKAGTIQAFGGSTAPDGWLICDGSAISRTLYADLFAVIGTNYGAGNGKTTFNIPNLIGLTSNNVPCCGNGKALGLTDGTTKTGYIGSGSWGNGSKSVSYGVTVGKKVGSGSYLANDVASGVTTEATKSGIVSALSLASQKSLAIIKY